MLTKYDLEQCQPKDFRQRIRDFTIRVGTLVATKPENAGVEIRIAVAEPYVLKHLIKVISDVEI